ncbi:MAG: DUF1559 domain-containing protein [Planctomycetota bacterium]
MLPTQPTRRTGFTLVELLVVIAIIGLLVALLLPAVQAAREAARRTECKSHLKQIGLALMTYHDAVGHYPAARSGSALHPGGTDPYAVSWAFRLLPYLEERAIHDAWQPAERVDSPANAVAMRTPVSVYYCPSRRGPAADRDFDNNDAPSLVPDAAAGGDYAANSGRSTRNGMAAYGRERFDGESFGPMYTLSAVSARRVTDGLSKTFAVGEKHLPPEVADAVEGTEDYLRGDTAHFAGDNRHVVVRRSSAGFPDGPDDRYTGKFGSDHDGFTHFAFLDGSVRALQHDIDLDTYQALSIVADGLDVPDEAIDFEDD